MEKWIKNNQQKIGLLCALFIMYCFYTIVKDGGAVIPRVEALEIKTHNQEHEHEHQHTHRYDTGAAVWK